MQTLFTFYKTSNLNKEVNCTELSLSVRVPWLKCQLHSAKLYTIDKTENWTKTINSPPLNALYETSMKVQITEEKKVIISLKVTDINIQTKDIFVQLGSSVSNWQKVQLNTDLLQNRTLYLYTDINGWLKLNEIKMIKKLIRAEREINLGGRFYLQTVWKNPNREVLGLLPKYFGQIRNMLIIFVSCKIFEPLAWLY